jgi:hypothetical protein
MRQVNHFLLLLLTIALIGCEKDDDNSPSADSDKADRFTCNINGVPFVTNGNINCASKLFSFYPETAEGAGDGYLVFGGTHCPSSKNIGIRLYGMEPSIGLIDMTSPTYADTCSPFVRVRDEPGQSEIFDELISGTLNITDMYPRNIDNTDEFGRFRGTFEFTVKSETSGDTLKVTDGSFNYEVGSFW